MIFRGDYFKDEHILKVWYEEKNGWFHIVLSEGNGGLDFSGTTKEERDVFVQELDRRMSKEATP